MLAMSLLMVLSFALKAEQSQDFGDYVVHFNALPTSFLTPKTAQDFDIVRSKQRAILTVSVMKKVLGTTGQSVQADVAAQAINLSNQVKEIDMREVTEGSAIYQLGDFRITDQEILNFTIDVKPKGETQTLTVKFRQQFFAE
jgi:hypothetical protein